MKKGKKRLFAILSCLIMIATIAITPINVSAASSTETTGNMSERTTESIVEEILNGCYGYHVLLQSTPDLAYSYLLSRYEVFAELETKPDAAEVLYSRYMELTSDDVESMDEETYFNVVLLRAMLVQPIYHETLQIAEPAAEMQDVSTLATNGTEPAAQIGDAYVVYDLTDVEHYTLGQNRVYLYYTDDEYPSYIYTSLENTIASQCEGITKIADHTAKYNCHSYAWYLRSTYNQYWLNDISPYLDDLHYEETTASNAEVGDVVVYFNDTGKVTHSAIIYSISMSSIFVPIITCESKMGACGVYRHSVSNVPDDYMNAGSADYKIYTYSNTHTYTGSYYQHDLSYHTRQCAYCTALTTFVHVYTVTGYTSTGHTFTCRMCSQTKTEAHTPDAQTGKCTKCAYTGPVTVNPILSILPELQTESCDHCAVTE